MNSGKGYASVNTKSALPPPPPLGNSRAFTHILILGTGHLKFYYCPRGRAFAYPRDNPGTVDTLEVLVLHVVENANMMLFS